MAWSVCITARPILFQVMEDGLARVMLTRLGTVLFHLKCLARTAPIRTVILCAISGHLGHFISFCCGGGCLAFGLLLSIIVLSCAHLPQVRLFDRVRGHGYRARLEKLCPSSLRVVCMCRSTASYDSLEFIPLPGDLVAALPAFFQVVEDRLARVELALCTVIFVISEHLIATRSLAPLLTYLCGLCLYHLKFLIYTIITLQINFQ